MCAMYHVTINYPVASSETPHISRCTVTHNRKYIIYARQSSAGPQLDNSDTHLSLRYTARRSPRSSAAAHDTAHRAQYTTHRERNTAHRLHVHVHVHVVGRGEHASNWSHAPSRRGDPHPPTPPSPTRSPRPRGRTVAPPFLGASPLAPRHRKRARRVPVGARVAVRHEGRPRLRLDEVPEPHRRHVPRQHLCVLRRLAARRRVRVDVHAHDVDALPTREGRVWDGPRGRV